MIDNGCHEPRSRAKAVRDADACSILCVTDRKLCGDDFLSRLARIAVLRPAGIILREKDLGEVEYEALARQVLECCGKTPLVIHGHPKVARDLGCMQLHLPLCQLEALSAKSRAGWSQLSASCHSLEEARRAVGFGCTRIVVGHVFDTRCKPGVPPRGLAFLQSVCAEVAVDVYAIGGITPGRMAAVREAGAAGACMMSGFMQADDVSSLFEGSMRRSGE